MTKPLIILPEDRWWLEERIDWLDQQIKALGPEFHEVLNQSSETWHDNAPFDAVREKQDLLVAQRSQLKQILVESVVEQPLSASETVQVGTTIALQQGQKIKQVFIAGDWSYRSGKTIDGVLIISRQSPLAQAVLGKKMGQQTNFGTVISMG